MKKVIKNITMIATGAVLVTSCVSDPDSPGLEWMPDMYRSPAVEAYVDYGEIRNIENKELKVTLSAKTPPMYTIPFKDNRTEAAHNMPFPFKAPMGADRSHNLYGWEMYTSAEEFQEDFDNGIANYANPIMYSETAFNEGKEIYARACAVCHGETGKGDGPISAKIGGVANFTAGEPQTRTDGQLFYYITYGKGNMGAHAMILDRTERWKVVQYVRGLQNGGKYPEDGGLGINTAKDDSTGQYVSSILDKIQFKTGSAKFDLAASKRSLNGLVAFMRINPDFNVEISGHTDNTGSEEVNKPLSQDRAEAIKNYIVGYGIEASRINAVGFGSEKPIAPNGDELGRQMNRRTEIVIVE